MKRQQIESMEKICVGSHIRPYHRGMKSPNRPCR
nr:MAG TPA_asm: hypothetical protein [Caudoviricetes sp.]